MKSEVKKLDGLCALSGGKDQINFSLFDFAFTFVHSNRILRVGSHWLIAIATFDFLKNLFTLFTTVIA